MEGYQQLMARVLRILKISFGVDLASTTVEKIFNPTQVVASQLKYNTSPYTGMDG